jgi:hypothetical protein
MSPEERSLLERTYKMAEENNKLILSIRRHARIGTSMKVIYWMIILGLSFGAYYFIQPFIKAITGGAYGTGEVQNTSNVGGIEDRVKMIQELLN